VTGVVCWVCWDVRSDGLDVPGGVSVVSGVEPMSDKVELRHVVRVGYVVGLRHDLLEGPRTDRPCGGVRERLGEEGELGGESVEGGARMAGRRAGKHGHRLQRKRNRGSQL